MLNSVYSSPLDERFKVPGATDDPAAPTPVVPGQQENPYTQSNRDMEVTEFINSGVKPLFGQSGVGATKEKIDQLADKSSASAPTASGYDYAGVINSGIQLGANIYAQEQSVSKNKKESTANTISTTMQGAQFGNQVGGTYGAIIGAVAGLGYGLTKADRDMKKRVMMRNRQLNRDQQLITANRERDQRMAEGKQQIENLASLQKAQIGILPYN